MDGREHSEIQTALFLCLLCKCCQAVATYYLCKASLTHGVVFFTSSKSSMFPFFTTDQVPFKYISR